MPRLATCETVNEQLSHRMEAADETAQRAVATHHVLGSRRQLRTLIVGTGKSGSRFLRAITYGKASARFAVVGVVDLNPHQLSELHGRYPTYTDVQRALADTAPDVVVVCVNEHAHLAVLQPVLADHRVRHIVCEKPLTRTLEEFQTLLPVMETGRVSVNFCERYSHTVDQCVAWLDRHQATISRMEFWWGKDRIRDSRPTMGVLSELSHPLDLTRYLLGRPDAGLIVHSATAIHSDFATQQDSVVDSVNVVAQLGQCTIIGSSSFVWDERRRRIVAYAQRQSPATTWRIVLEFDNPVWDNDTLAIHEIPDEGTARLAVLTARHLADDLPPEIRHVAKLHRYLLDVADSATGSQRPRLADAADALRVQTDLEKIQLQCQLGTQQLHGRLFDLTSKAESGELA